MSWPLTLGNCLILACARIDPDPQRIQELVEQGPDWQGILRKAERWGLAPLIYTNLRQAAQSGHVPKPVTEHLRHLFHRDTIHGVARRELLRATLLRFAEARVPVIVLKGAALATLVYPSPALRPIGDIDLLVHRRDLERVEAVLRRMWYALRSPAMSGAGPDAPPGNPYLGPEAFSLLDVRHHIFSPRSAADRIPAAVSLPIEGFWERACPAQIASVATLVLSHEDLLLHLALHLAYAGGFVGQVRTLCDIGEVCRRYGEALDWSQLVAQARAYEMGKALYYALRLARELVGAGVPSRALTELRASFGQLPLEDRFIAAGARRAILCTDQDPHPPSKFYRLGVRLLATRRATEGVRIGCRHLARACLARLRRLASRAELRRTRFTNGVLRARLPATAIVLPIYRPRLEAEALMAVDRAVAVLRHGDWYLIAPQSLDTSFYEQRYGKPIVRFPDADFASAKSYSRLLLTDEFYAAFAQYEYMLITQDDVYVVRDDLPYWLSRRLDYIGAPWWPDGLHLVLSEYSRLGIHGVVFKTYVANGGFSLRRIAACRQLLTEFPEEAARVGQTGGAEDSFFALFGQLSQQFVLPNLRVAAAFAWEVSLPHMYALCQGQLPMAIHAYGRYDPEFFVRTILPKASSSC